MKTKTSLKLFVLLACLCAAALPITSYSDDPPPMPRPARPIPPTRSPTAAGTPTLTAVGMKAGDATLHGVPGMNPPVDVDGDFLIGPDYLAAPELTPVEAVPKGRIETLTMNSVDSKLYPGITKVPPGGPPDYVPPDLNNVPIYPKPYTRTVTVYIPAGYVKGVAAPVIVVQDGPDKILPPVLDNLIAQQRVPAMIAVMIQNGGGDSRGSERGLEYDTLSGRYADFVETEVFPFVEKSLGVTISKDPDARATMGTSSGGVAAFSMAWYHPERYHRVLTYSGTYVNQAYPFNSEAPHGGWEYHEHLIPQSARKPIRVWLQVGDRDLLNPNSLRDDMHDWVEANNRMATALKAKGYHYQYVYCLNAGHGDAQARAQTLPQALEWLWHDYQSKATH
jgi:enterochelin esterase-like enzyme